jgi:hypothetical protein
MAQFIGYVEGNGGPASRTGSKNSGLSAQAQGWNVGGKVVITHEDGCDVVRVYKTSGSNARKASELIAEFTAE